MTRSAFHVFRDDVFRLYVDGRYGDALALVDRESVRFPERWDDTLYWQACLTALRGDLDGALRTLMEAVHRGHWWSEGSLRTEPDLKRLQGDARFESLVATCRQRHAQAEVVARPEVRLLPPCTEQAATPKSSPSIGTRQRPRAGSSAFPSHRR